MNVLECPPPLPTPRMYRSDPSMAFWCADTLINEPCNISEQNIKLVLTDCMYIDYDGKNDSLLLDS